MPAGNPPCQIEIIQNLYLYYAGIRGEYTLRKRLQTGFIVLFPTACAIACTFIVWICRALSENSSDLNVPLAVNAVIAAALFTFSVLFCKKHFPTLHRALEIERQAYIDAMTQVRNRAALNLKIEELNAAASPRLTLFMIDLNNLKQVNDTLGHPAGDRLICALVHCLEQAFGKIGQIYRYGGDEFVILIENASLDEVMSARTLLDKLIADHALHGGCEISAAIGMASRQQPQNANLHVAELLRLADVAMYHFKNTQKSAPSYIKSSHHRWLEQIDASTGILNLSAFKSRIYDALASNTSTFPCIVNFDLNFFDGYNNLFGWDAGNQLLHKLTSLAMSLCGAKGFCAHGEADSFWIFPDAADLKTLTDRITEQTRIFQSQLNDFLLFPSFGIYCINDLMLPVSDMCSRAVSAKREIKGHLDVLYEVYNTEDHLRRIEHTRLTACLHRGLDSNEFVPYYQPKYQAGTQKVVGAEALVRWMHAPENTISPSEFTNFFEKSGLILSLDWHMTEKVCVFLRKQMDAGRHCVPVAVNFSRLHMYEKDCTGHLIHLVQKHQIPRNLLEIELTETAEVPNSDRLLNLISELRKEGFSVAISSFGSGHSSVGLLKSVAVDVVKLDDCLTRILPDTDPMNVVPASVVSMCKALNIVTVAEGIETREQMELLTACGCDILQGCYLSPVLSEKDFARLLEPEKNGKH